MFENDLIARAIETPTQIRITWHYYESAQSNVSIAFKMLNVKSNKFQ